MSLLCPCSPWRRRLLLLQPSAVRHSALKLEGGSLRLSSASVIITVPSVSVFDSALPLLATTLMWPHLVGALADSNEFECVRSLVSPVFNRVQADQVRVCVQLNVQQWVQATQSFSTSSVFIHCVASLFTVILTSVVFLTSSLSRCCLISLFIDIYNLLSVIVIPFAMVVLLKPVVCNDLKW